MKTKQFHVYALDGFESAHSSARAAVTAAKRGAKLRGVLYTVVRCSLSGYTGAGNGTEIWASNGQIEAPNPHPLSGVRCGALTVDDNGIWQL